MFYRGRGTLLKGTDWLAWDVRSQRFGFAASRDHRDHVSDFRYRSDLPLLDLRKWSESNICQFYWKRPSCLRLTPLKLPVNCMWLIFMYLPQAGPQHTHTHTHIHFISLPLCLATAVEIGSRSKTECSQSKIRILQTLCSFLMNAGARYNQISCKCVCDCVCWWLIS